MVRHEEEPPWPLPTNWNDHFGGYYPTEEQERREMEEQEAYIRGGYLNDPERKFKVLSPWVGHEAEYKRDFTAEHWDPYENDVLLVRPEPPPPEPPFKRYIVLGLVLWWLLHRFLDWRHRKKIAYRRERDERMQYGIPWWDKRDFDIAYADVLDNRRSRENRWRIRHGLLPLWEDESGKTYELFEWDNFGRPYPPDPTPEEIAQEKKRLDRLEKRKAWKKKLKETGQAYIFPGALEDLSDPEDFTPGFDDNPDYFDLEIEQERPLDQKVEPVKEREATPQPPGAFPREEPRYLNYHQYYSPYQAQSFYGEPAAIAAVSPAVTQPAPQPTSQGKRRENNKKAQTSSVQALPKSTTPTPVVRRPAPSHDDDDGEVSPRTSKRRKTSQTTNGPKDDNMVIDEVEATDQPSMEICDPERRGTKRTRADDQEPESTEGPRKRVKTEVPAASRTKSKTSSKKHANTHADTKVEPVVDTEEDLPPNPNETMLAKDGITSTDPLCEGRYIGDVWAGIRWIFRVGMQGRRERLGEMVCQSRIPNFLGQMPEKQRIQYWISEQEYAEAKVLGTMDSRTHFCHMVIPIDDINEYCWARAPKILRSHPTRFRQRLHTPPPRPDTPPLEPPRPVDPLAGILESLPETPNQGTTVFVSLHRARMVTSVAKEPALSALYGLHASESPSRTPYTPKAELPQAKSTAKSVSSSGQQHDKTKPKDRPKPRKDPVVLENRIGDIEAVVSATIAPTKEQKLAQSEAVTPIKSAENVSPSTNEYPYRPIPATPIVIAETVSQSYISEPPVTLPSTSPTEEMSPAMSIGDVALRTAPRPKTMSKKARLERISTQLSSVPSKLSPSEAMNEAIRKLANKPARPSPLSQCITAEVEEPRPSTTAAVNTSPPTTDTSPTSSVPSDSTPVLVSQRSSFVAPVTPSSSSSPQSPFDISAPVLSSNLFSSGTHETMTPHTPALQDNYGGLQPGVINSDQAYDPVIVNSVPTIVEDSSMMMDIVMSPPPSKVEFTQYTETSTLNHNPFQVSFQNPSATPVESPTQGFSGPPLGGFGNVPSNFMVAQTSNGSNTTTPVWFPASGYSPTPGSNGQWFTPSTVLEIPSVYTPTDAHFHPDPSRRPPPGTSQNNRIFKTYKRLQKSTTISGQPTGDEIQSQWGVNSLGQQVQVSTQPSPQFHQETTGPGLSPTFTHFMQGHHQQSLPQQQQQQQQQQQYLNVWDPNQFFKMQM